MKTLDVKRTKLCTKVNRVGLSNNITNALSLCGTVLVSDRTQSQKSSLLVTKREIITLSPIQNRCTFVSTPFLDYEELKIAIGNATATGRNSISLDDESDAKIYGVEENVHVTIDDRVR